MDCLWRSSCNTACSAEVLCLYESRFDVHSYRRRTIPTPMLGGSSLSTSTSLHFKVPFTVDPPNIMLLNGYDTFWVCSEAISHNRASCPNNISCSCAHRPRPCSGEQVLEMRKCTLFLKYSWTLMGCNAHFGYAYTFNQTDATVLRKWSYLDTPR